MPYINGLYVMDNSFYTGSQYQIPAYSPLKMAPSTQIHPNSPAGLLGMTPEELKPILQDQQEFLRNEFAQPPPIFTRPTTYHLTPATQQLGPTAEEVEEAEEHHREWMREEEE